ncbi:MAG: response regulator transcription factor [Ferruginibacter sp.]
MKKILIADDHSIIRSGIISFLKNAYPAVKTAEAINEETILQQLKESAFDLLIMDMHMPDTNIFRLIEVIHETYRATPILIFSMSPEKTFGVRVLKAGASGFLSKESSLDEMEKAVNLLLNNKKYVSEELAAVLADQSSSKTDNPFDSLSAREFQLANLLLQGKSLSDIAKQLKIEISTASTYKSRIFIKLRVNNLFELKEMSTAYNL